MGWRIRWRSWRGSLGQQRERTLQWGSDAHSPLVRGRTTLSELSEDQNPATLSCKSYSSARSSLAVTISPTFSGRGSTDRPPRRSRCMAFDRPLATVGPTLSTITCCRVPTFRFSRRAENLLLSRHQRIPALQLDLVGHGIAHGIGRGVSACKWAARWHACGSNSS